MMGYYEDEEETKKVIDADGYFRSGDIGYIDKDGFIFITGRSKNVIVTQNGKNIYPEEIEMLLEKLDEIKEVMVYGKEPENNSRKEAEELIITARVIPDKEKIKVLRNIILHHKVDKDLVDLRYSKVPKEAKTLETRNEFISSIDNLDIRIMNATGYIRSIQKEKRKLKRKQAFCKVLGISMRK